MRLPAGRETPRLNILVAYPYFKNQAAVLTEHQDKIRLLVDSGAFTAFRQKKVITLDDYCRFLETLQVRPWGYFVLDVIGQPEATLRNYEMMLARGFDPIPIFTRGAELAHLETYYTTSDVVGIGGLVGTAKNLGFVNGIMDHVGKRPVHLLGFTNIPFLQFYKPFSADSSSWWMDSQYGGIRLYMGHGKFRYIKRRHCQQPLPLEIQQRLALYGIDAPMLARESSWGRDKGAPGSLTKAYQESVRHVANMRGMVNAARDVELNLGTKYFFACVGGVSDPVCLIDAWRWHETKAAA